MNDNKTAITRYLASLYKHKILDKDEEYQLLCELKTHAKDSPEYKKILDTLIKSNLRFVVNFAKNYVSATTPLEDLVAEGNVGLIKGIESYDISKKTKGITYFKWWILQSILLYKSSNSYMMRLPINIINDGLKLSKVITDKLSNSEDETIDSSVLAEEMGITEKKVDELIAYMNSSLSYKSENELQNYSEKVGSEINYNEDSIDNIDLLLSILSPIQIDVLKRSIGLPPYPKAYNLLEISEVYDKTSERIRQIKVEAMDKLQEYYSEEDFKEIFNY